MQLSQVTPTKLCTLRSHLMGRRYFLRFKYPFVNADKFELDYRGLHLRFVLIFEVEVLQQDFRYFVSWVLIQMDELIMTLYLEANKGDFCLACSIIIFTRFEFLIPIHLWNRIWSRWAERIFENQTLWFAVYLFCYFCNIGGK